MHARARTQPSRPPLRTVPAASPVSSPVFARVTSMTDDGEVRLSVGSQEISARLDPSVDAVVIAGAAARGERVVAQEEDGVWLVLGALRARATPGIDPMEDCAIHAKRIHLEAVDEVRLHAGESSLVLRALGHVETVARHITSRAAGVHKIVGRMLHLN